MLRVAPWVVSIVVSKRYRAGKYRGPPCRTEYVIRRDDNVQDLVRAVEITLVSQREKRVLLHLAPGGPPMTRRSPPKAPHSRVESLLRMARQAGQYRPYVLLLVFFSYEPHPKALRTNVAPCWRFWE